VAELAEEIDVQRAELARDLCAQRMNELSPARGATTEVGEAPSEAGVAQAEAESALARAELRLAVLARQA
jgi:hypothetical protein